jgi:formylglycine-generating enzyme required for sulfatase activity
MSNVEQKRRQAGYYLIPVVFLIVVLAAMGLFLSRMSEVTQESHGLAILRHRAEQAAKSGMEWTKHQILAGGNHDLVCSTAPATTTSFGLTGGVIDGFQITATCDDQRVGGFDEGWDGYEVTNITVTATKGTPLSPGFVSQTISEVVSPGKFLGMDFILIPAGTFTMGCDGPTDSASGEACDPNSYGESPAHSVTINQAFYMATTEVTQGQWYAVMGSNPASFTTCGSDCPVEQVSYDDIQTFLTTLNGMGEGTYRLPTEAEWEYAARAGTTTAWSFGDVVGSLGDYAWYSSNSGSTTHPVAQKLPNPWGLYDMYGNVREWVQDWHDSNYYASSPASDPTGPTTGSYRVLRGGFWDDPQDQLRSANRHINSPSLRINAFGLRLLKQP